MSVTEMWKNFCSPL